MNLGPAAVLVAWLTERKERPFQPWQKATKKEKKPFKQFNWSNPRENLYRKLKDNRKGSASAIVQLVFVPILPDATNNAWYKKKKITLSQRSNELIVSPLSSIAMNPSYKLGWQENVLRRCVTQLWTQRMASRILKFQYTSFLSDLFLVTSKNISGYW